MTKKDILDVLKKTYKRATNDVFSEDSHIFNNNDFTCQLTLNPDKTLTITNSRSQGCPRFQSGEELANSVGKINA